MKGKICGFRKGQTKDGKSYAIGYCTYTSDKFDGLGCQVAEVFIPDDVLKAIDERKIIGSECTLSGCYNRKGEWHIKLDRIAV